MELWAAAKGVLKYWTPSGILAEYYRRRQGPLRMPPDMPRLLPVRGLGELFPGIQSTEVRFPVSLLEGRGEWTLPLAELSTLIAICSHTRPRRIYEMGTYTGTATLAMAMNTPRSTEIFTLDLDPAETAALGLTPDGTDASRFIVGSSYRGTPFESRVCQLTGNTMTFDHSPYYRTMDLVFIDANHTYPFVKNDTENAFKLLRSGGSIIWDDYAWDERHPECAGVTQCLNELAPSRPVFQIRGTRLAIYLDRIEGTIEAQP